MIEQAAQSSLPEVERSRALSHAARLLQLMENSETLLGRYISPEQHAASAAQVGESQLCIVDLSEDLSTPRDSPNSQQEPPA